MAGVGDDELVKLRGFPRGIDNVSPESSVKPGALRTARNVDIDDAGKLRRRRGSTKVVNTPNMHSLYSHERLAFMLAVVPAGLTMIDDTLLPLTLAPVARFGDRMSFETAEHHVFASNGHESFRVSLDGAVSAFSPPQPGGQPTVSVNTVAGGLYAGEYQIAITFSDEFNRESGSTLSTLITVPEGGGITLTAIPQDAAAARVNIYMSAANGDVMYLADTIPTGVGTYLLGRRTLGRALDKQFLAPMPACKHLMLQNGIMHGAVKNVHVWSDTLNYGLYNPSTNYASYNAEITLIARMGSAGQAGTFIAAGQRTYYMSGPSPTDWQRVIAHPYGAVPYTLVYVAASDLELDVEGVLPVWMDTRGELIAGLPGGRVQRLHKATYAAPKDLETGASIMVERDGIRQLLTVVQGGQANQFAASDSVDAEICRNGVVVG